MAEFCATSKKTAASPISKSPTCHLYPRLSFLGLPGGKFCCIPFAYLLATWTENCAPEIRNQIYQHVFVESEATGSANLLLLLSCRQVYRESDLLAWPATTFQIYHANIQGLIHALETLGHQRASSIKNIEFTEKFFGDRTNRRIGRQLAERGLQPEILKLRVSKTRCEGKQMTTPVYALLRMVEGFDHFLDVHLRTHESPAAVQLMLFRGLHGSFHPPRSRICKIKNRVLSLDHVKRSSKVPPSHWIIEGEPQWSQEDMDEFQKNWG
jgi:hypothetical protein